MDRNGTSLGQCIFEFGNSDLINQLNTIKTNNTKIDQKASLSSILLSGIESIQNINNANNQKAELLNQLKADLIKQIQKGELIALGYQLPLENDNKPVQIDPLYFNGEINWDKNELTFKNLEFTAIKLFKNENSIKNKENPKKEIQELNPDQLIDEKQASQLMGISPRTLQGYRVKGGGPEFIKLNNKIVRYKICDIQNWINENKKNNTI